MKKIAILGLLLSLCSFGSFAADSGVLGVWETEPGETGVSAHVKIAACGDRFCGVIVGLSEDRPKKIGVKMVWDMQEISPGKFDNGKILDPSAGKTYNSKMELDGNTLHVSGCVVMFCKTQNWKRVN